jgi:hypothetical protein
MSISSVAERTLAQRRRNLLAIAPVSVVHVVRLRLEELLVNPGNTLNPAVSRRTVFRGLAGFLAGSPLLRSQQDPFHDHSRVPALGEMLNAFDFEPVACAKVIRQSWDFLSWGVDGEWTMRRNREAFDWVELVPRGIAGSAPVQTASNFLGFATAVSHTHLAHGPPRAVPSRCRGGHARRRHGRIQHAVYREQ